MPSTEQRLEAALLRMDKLERKIAQLQQPRRRSKPQEEVDRNGGIIVNRKERRVTVLSPPEEPISARTKKGRFWQHVAFNQ